MASIVTAFTWWLQTIWQGFKWTPSNTQAHSGIDLGMPCGSPLTSPVNGTVISSGMENWGGQTNILVPPGSMPVGYDQSSPYVLSFLHESRIDVPSGPVAQGQQIGLSGQPPPGYGSGCHLHFEVTHGSTAPYMGYSPWHPTATSYPQDPAPFLNALGGNAVPVGKFGGYSVTGANQATASAPPQPGQWCFSILGSQICIPVIRIAKIILASILIAVAALLFIVPNVAPPVLKGAGVVSGQPALVQVGSAISGKRKRNANFQSDQAAVSVAQTVQARRAATTRNLGGNTTNPLPEQKGTAEEAKKPPKRNPLPPQGSPGTARGVGSLVKQRNPPVPPAAIPVGQASVAPPTTPPQRGPATQQSLPYTFGSQPSGAVLKTSRGDVPLTNEQLRQLVETTNRNQQKQLAKAKTRRAREPRGQRTTIGPAPLDPIQEQRMRESAARGAQAIRDAFGLSKE